MKKILTLSCCVVIALATARAQVSLISFGPGNLTVEPGATTAAYTLTPAGLVFNGTYGLGATLGAEFSTIQDWATHQLTEFGLFLTVAGANPGLSFSVGFYVGDFESIHLYQGSTAGIGNSPTYVPLTLSSPQGTGDFSKVRGIQFTWDGGGAVNATVQGVGGRNAWLWRAPSGRGELLGKRLKPAQAECHRARRIRNVSQRLNPALCLERLGQCREQ